MNGRASGWPMSRVSQVVSLSEERRRIPAGKRGRVAQMSGNPPDDQRRPSHDSGLEPDLVRSLKATISDLPSHERPKIEQVALGLGISVRTLQRLLQRTGHSFEEVLDDVWRETAIEELSKGSVSITETAFMLGYSDISHFTRAFRRWTGVAPREFAEAAKRSKRKPPMQNEQQ